MKLKKIMHMMNLRVFFLFWGLGILSLPIVAASEIAYSVDLNGKWKPIGKSIPSFLPITASIDSRILSIENASPDCNIIITIINDNGEIIYQQEVSAANTASICIPMDGFPTGEYTLELTNPSGNYLRGNFILYQ